VSFLRIAIKRLKMAFTLL